MTYSTDAEGMHKMFAAKHALDPGLPTPLGTPPKLSAIDANGITKRIRTIRPVATSIESQAGFSRSTQFHCTTPHKEVNRPRECGDNGDQCPAEEDEEIQSKEEDD